jgi:hypothetical protein
MYYNESRYYQQDDWVFIAIPKNASTSILKPLGYDFHQQESSLLHYKQLKDYNKSFAVIRNPYDRLVSCWMNRIIQHKKIYNQELLGTDWIDFVDRVIEIPDDNADEHFRSQSWFLDKVEEYAQTLISMDRLEQDWYKIQEIVNKEIPLIHTKKSKKGSWEMYYSDQIKEKVYKRYEDDFKLYDKINF